MNNNWVLFVCFIEAQVPVPGCVLRISIILTHLILLKSYEEGSIIIIAILLLRTLRCKKLKNLAQGNSGGVQFLT